MAKMTGYDTRLSAEGRVVIPAEVRRVLGVEPGGQVLFVVEGQEVRISTPRLFAEHLWANNQGSDAGDSALDVRTVRDEDRRGVDVQWERIAAEVQFDEHSDEDVTTDLFQGLGLNQ